MGFERFAVVRVPFPFTDSAASKNRPVPVLSHPDRFNAPARHSIMAMITAAANAPWPSDCPVTDLAAAGLPAPSSVRFKLFTLDHLGSNLGQLSTVDGQHVGRGLAELFDLRVAAGA